MICVRLNPNVKKNRGRFGRGWKMLRFMDGLGRQVDSAASKNLNETRDKIASVAARFKPTSINWGSDPAAALETARKQRKLLVVLSWSEALDDKSSWTKFIEAKPPGWYLKDFVFVKAEVSALADLGAPPARRFLVFDPAAKDFTKKPLLRRLGPLRPSELIKSLFECLLKRDKK